MKHNLSVPIMVERTTSSMFLLLLSLSALQPACSKRFATVQLHDAKHVTSDVQDASTEAQLHDEQRFTSHDQEEDDKEFLDTDVRITEEDGKELFDTVDEDNSGSVSFAEWTEADGEKFFNMIDKDNSGLLSFGEWSSFFGNLKVSPDLHKQLKSSYHEMDANGDQAISKDEFLPWFTVHSDDLFSDKGIAKAMFGAKLIDKLFTVDGRKVDAVGFAKYMWFMKALNGKKAKKLKEAELQQFNAWWKVLAPEGVLTRAKAGEAFFLFYWEYGY